MQRRLGPACPRGDRRTVRRGVPFDPVPACRGAPWHSAGCRSGLTVTLVRREIPRSPQLGLQRPCARVSRAWAIRFGRLSVPKRRIIMNATKSETRAAALDPQKIEALLGRVVGDIGGAYCAALTVIGDELGLFRA